MVILHTKHLKKYYGEEPNVIRAVDDVDLSVNMGEFVVIIGTSGSGKSTLLHMIGGLDIPTAGSVFVREKELSEMKDEELSIFRRRNIGFVFQNYNLVPILNVYENIVLPVELDGGTVDQGFMDEVVHVLGLEDKLKSMPNNLSGGQQQRVAIARALAMRPRMLFFDEPTSALDPEITAGILRILRQLAEEKMTMIIVTHEIDFARKVADRVVFMDGGVVVEQGKPEDVIDHPQNERTKMFLQKMEV